MICFFDLEYSKIEEYHFNNMTIKNPYLNLIICTGLIYMQSSASFLNF